MKLPRVILADDHTILLEALRKLLESRCEIIGTARNGRVLLEMARTQKPDVIVLDVAMPLLNGLDAARRLKRDVPDVKLIFLTMNEDSDIAREALQLGASGYVLKNSAVSELFVAIHDARQWKNLHHAASRSRVGEKFRSRSAGMGAAQISDSTTTRSRAAFGRG